MAAAELPYRPCVGMMVINDDGNVFAARRIDMVSEAWQMPQGGIDKGEDPRKAMFRELEEEIGTGEVAIIAESDDWFDYDLPDHLIGQLWGGKYRGQTQKWFLVKLTTDDSAINIDTDHPEFCEWKWVDPYTLPDLAVSFKREVYEKVLTAFKSHLK